MRKLSHLALATLLLAGTAACSDDPGNEPPGVSTTPDSGTQTEEVLSQAEKTAFSTGLPVVYIETPNRKTIDSKEVWMDGATLRIIKPDKSVDYQGTISIRGRGNTTWSYPKKPYAVRLEARNEILGMKKHRRWCLLAQWMDRTLMRNAVAYEIARNTGLAWTPSGKYVEVILNGRHIGNYYLCEQLKVDKNRVNITETDPNSTQVGGFLFELDVYYDETYKFRSKSFQLPWMLKDPDEVNLTQFNYAQQYVNEMEDALANDTRFANREFTQYMDLESWADVWIVHELCCSWEPNHPKSFYTHLDKDGKMTAGPVWDFDWGTFRPGTTGTFQVREAVYYKRLFQDETFRLLVRERWNSYKEKIRENVSRFIDETANTLHISDAENQKLWPINSGSKPNGDEQMAFSTAVERLKTSFLAKYSWLDAQIQDW